MLDAVQLLPGRSLVRAAELRPSVPKRAVNVDQVMFETVRQDL